jgi:hypothetical protein
MAPMLPLFDALAGDAARGMSDGAILHAGPGRALTIRIQR